MAGNITLQCSSAPALYSAELSFTSGYLDTDHSALTGDSDVPAALRMPVDQCRRPVPAALPAGVYEGFKSGEGLALVHVIKSCAPHHFR